MITLINSTYVAAFAAAFLTTTTSTTTTTTATTATITPTTASVTAAAVIGAIFQTATVEDSHTNRSDTDNEWIVCCVPGRLVVTSV